MLDRILDKGLVIAGDIKVSLANVELLTLQIRLLVCSIDKAEQIGLNWWRYDRSLVNPDGTLEGDQSDTIKRLEARIAELEQQIQEQSLAPAATAAPAARRRGGTSRRQS